MCLYDDKKHPRRLIVLITSLIHLTPNDFPHHISFLLGTLRSGRAELFGGDVMPSLPRQCDCTTTVFTAGLAGAEVTRGRG